jgi:hypothetical protein
VFDVGHEPPAERLRRRADRLTLARVHQHMDMIGHQRIGVDPAAMLACGSVQRVEVDPVIAIAEKDSLSVVTALHDMHRHARKEEATLPRHGLLPCPT